MVVVSGSWLRVVVSVGGQQTPPPRLLGSVGENVKFVHTVFSSFSFVPLSRSFDFARQGPAEASRVILQPQIRVATRRRCDDTINVKKIKDETQKMVRRSFGLWPVGITKAPIPRHE